jgi:hypothetical protein
MNRIEIETDLFEHRAVKPDSINPCSFGQDFAAWLQERLGSPTGEAYVFSNPIQEDYGWGFWASRSGDRFWIAISYVGDGPQDGPAQWIVSVEQAGAVNFIQRILHKPDAARSAELRDRVKRALEKESAIKILDANQMP